jgi:hypothetical protein
MNYARLLCEGVGSWLQFEHACGRTELFSEKYLSQPVGQILSARSGSRARAEYLHPVLSDLAKGPGRRPEIDFVVCDPYPDIAIAVESKWIGKTKPSIDKILWDLIRLEMLAHHSRARCFFLLGGTRADLDNYFKHKLFSGIEPGNQAKALLRTDVNRAHKTALVPTAELRIPILKKLFEAYQHFEFPHYVISRRSTPFPSEGPGNRYQIYVWEISSATNRETFRPKNSRHYSLDGSSQRDFYRDRAKRSESETDGLIP